MSYAIAGAVIIGGATIYAANKSASSADKALAGADAAAQLQYNISQQQIDMANEQWDTYKNEILPLEQESQRLGITAQELAAQRGKTDLKLYEDFYAPLQESFVQDAANGIEADPERAAREARVNMDQSFDSAEGQMSRSLQRRGVRPGSGADRAGIGDTSLARAAATGYSVNRSVEAERDRVEDVNFNRKAVALGRQPIGNAPTQAPGSPGISASGSASLLGAAGQTARGAGNAYGNIANTYGNAAAGIVSGGVQLGMQAYDLYNKYSTPSTAQTSYTPYAGTTSQGQANFSNANFDDISAFSTNFAEGGPVSAPMMSRGNVPPGPASPLPGGRVNGPPGRDQVPAVIQSPDGQTYDAALTDEEYVIPADVVRQVGTDELDEIVQRSRERKAKMSGQNALTRPGGA